MDAYLIKVLVRLLRIHDQFGQASFEAAAHRALVAIAGSVMLEVDKNARGNIFADENVVRFPLERCSFGILDEE